MVASTPTVLIIEDDSKTADSVRDGLMSAGCRPRIARTGEEGLRLLHSEDWEVVILDWMLPGCDGISVVRAIRDRGLRTPVLLITARDDVTDRVLGLDAGADDYLVKPFAFAELLARIRAIVRRADHDPVSAPCFGDLRIDLRTRRVHRGDRELDLTPREYDILACLVRHQNQIVTRRMLARDVWRESRRATPLDNAIDVHVGHLRRKIDDGAVCRLIHTIRGVGFVLREGDPP